ncbi:MAG: zinc dependent phospholipase C family protein [Oscillospiraceae bacterium]|jgi:hypothetical protein|nr:zinc dependent phospholipase C family protein [Oscillospiraceae bacterium]
MPAAITHYCQALRVWNQCQQELSLKSADAFLWGAQGPDFFYYHRILQPWSKNIREIGDRLHHEKPTRVLSAMRDFQNSKGNELTKSYLCGFLCHYSLDRTAHPFVYWDVASLHPVYPGRKDNFLHNHTESVLDGIVLRSFTGQLANDFDLKQTVPKNQEVYAAIEQLYEFVLERLYGIHSLRKDLIKSMSDCRKVCGLLNDRWMMKKPLAEIFGKVTHQYLPSSVIRGISEQDEFDYANILHAEWRWPKSQLQLRKESFFDLLEISIRESTHFLQEFQTADLYQLTQDIPFC